jgi:hypothetical protein
MLIVIEDYSETMLVRNGRVINIIFKFPASYQSQLLIEKLLFIKLFTANKG